MNGVRLTLIIIVVTALQAAFLPAWRPLGVVPDLLAAVVIVLALTAAASQTLICATVVGLVLDLNSAVHFGQNLGFYTVVALGVATLVRLGIAFDSVAWAYGLGVGVVVAGQGIVLIELALAHAALPAGPIIAKLLAGVIFELILVALARPALRRLLHTNDDLALGVVR